MKTNKSAARSMDLLLLLASAENPMTLLEIENALDIPKSSTFELVYTLVEKKFVEQIDKKFQLGINAFLVGISYSDKLNVIQVSKPVLNTLSKDSKETVFLAKYLNGKIIYLDKFSDYADMASTCKIGTTADMYYTGLGKAILTSWSDDKVRGYFESKQFEKFTERTIVTADDMLKELDLTRQRGYAMEVGEGKKDTFCVAAPILNYTNQVIAAISVTAPSYQMEKKMNLMIDLIKESALTISNKLGYTKDTLFH